jgi:selenocysteine lyase/cysteine desulfurase
VKVLHAGAEFLQSVGLEKIEARVRELTTTFMAMLDRAGLGTQTPPAWEERAQIVNVVVPDAAGLMDRLREKHRVVTNVKDGALRVSMSFFNNEADLEKAVWAIAKEGGARKAVA